MMRLLRAIPRGGLAAALPTLAAGLLMLSGCHGTVLRTGLAQTTQADRLMAHYRDLETGRFTVIADFEQTKHMELFRSVSTAGSALHRLSLTSGVMETGPRCLHAAFSRSEDQLFADGSRAKQWKLPRDWRDYDLLLMSVHIPGPRKLQLSLTSGHGQNRAVADSYIPLHAGWNLVRLDLADAAEYVALDDIRELGWSLPELTHPVVLLIDDIILTSNQADLFGDSNADTGAPYLRRRGRRWDLGAGGRFELGLINGQIKFWYNLALDPLRVRNLVEPGVLGPSVVSLSGENDSGMAIRGFPAQAGRVLVRQHVLEASAARIVVACRWDFMPTEQTEHADMPYLGWTYCLYPSGDMYVHVLCTTGALEATAENLGLAVSRRQTEGMQLVCHSTSQLGDKGRLLHVPYAYAGDDHSGLLFVVHDGRSTPLVECLRSEATAGITAVAFGGQTRRPTQHWDCLVSLEDHPGKAGGPAAARALQYCFPPTLSPNVGRVITDSEGDNDHDGFNERFGCYVLAPDANRVALTIDGSRSPFYSPSFVVEGSAGKEAWVYVDHAIFEDLGQTAGGDTVFQLPGTINTRRTLEVYLRSRTP